MQKKIILFIILFLTIIYSISGKKISNQALNFINSDYYYVNELIKSNENNNIINEILSKKIYFNDYSIIYLLLDKPLDYNDEIVREFITHSLSLKDKKISEKIIFNDEFITNISDSFFDKILLLLRETDTENFIKLLKQKSDNRYLPVLFQFYFSFLTDEELYYLKYDEESGLTFDLLFEGLKSYKETGLRFLLEELRIFEKEVEYDKNVLARVAEYSNILLNLYLSEDEVNIVSYVNEYKNSLVIQVLFIPYLTEEIILKDINYFKKLSEYEENINRISLLSKLSVTKDLDIHRKLVAELRNPKLSISDKINIIKSLRNYLHKADINVFRNYLNDVSLDVVIETVKTMLYIDSNYGSQEIRRFILNTPLSRYLIEKILEAHLEIVYLKDMELYKNILYSNNLNLINPLLDVLGKYPDKEFVAPYLYLLDHHRFVDKSRVVELMMNIIPEGVEALKRYFYEDKENIIKLILDYSIKEFNEEYMFFYITALRSDDRTINRPVIDFFVELGQNMYDKYLLSYEKSSIFRLRRNVIIIKEELLKKRNVGLFKFEDNFYSETDIIQNFTTEISKKIFIDNIFTDDIETQKKSFKILLNYELNNDDLIILSEAIDYNDRLLVEGITALFEKNILSAKNILNDNLNKDYSTFISKSNHIMWSLNLLKNITDYDFNNNLINVYNKQQDDTFKLELLRFLEGRTGNNEIEFLVNEFFESELRIKNYIIDLLAAIETENILEIFSNLLYLDNVETKRKITSILSGHQNDMLIRPFINLLDEKDVLIVQNSISGLKYYESDTVYQAIRPFLYSDSVVLRQQAILSLGNHTDTRVFEDLISLYIDEFHNVQIKRIIDEVMKNNTVWTIDMIIQKIEYIENENDKNKLKHLRNNVYPYK